MHQLAAENHSLVRPYKEGYLQKQINSIFDIWNTRYFYLDNTNFAYFNDEHTDKPSQIINLDDCIVDGVWRNGEYHTFTVRSLVNDEIFFYLGAFSAGEAEDWIKNLKAAVRLKEVEKMSEDMGKKQVKLKQQQASNRKDSKLSGNQGKKSFDVDDDENQQVEYTENNMPTSENEEFLEYLAKPHKEVRTSMPVQLDNAYHEFKRLLKHNDAFYSVVKSENNLNISLDEHDPKYKIYKSSFFINGEFYNLVKLLSSDTYEKWWNLYLTDIKQTRKLAESIHVYDATFEMTLSHFIFTMRNFYISQAWIKGDNFNVIKSTLSPSSKNYGENLLSFDLPLEMLGIRVEKLPCSYPKCKMTLIIKLRKKNMLLDKLFHKFIKKYMVAFTILRDELEELTEKYEKLNPPTEPKETRESIKVIPYPIITKKKEPLPNLALEKKKSAIAESVIKAMKPKVPSMLDPKTPQQMKAYEEIRKRCAAQNIEISDEMIKRFCISKEYHLDETVEICRKYVEWTKEMGFGTYKWDDPQLFGSYQNPKVLSHIGFDRGGRPVVYIRFKNYFPSKTPEEHFRKHAFGFLMWLSETQLKPGIEQYTIVADITDATKENISFSQCMTGAKTLLAYCPQYSHKMIIVNGGFLIKMIYNAAKPLLKERHKQRIAFVNSDGNEAYNILKQEMDDDLIPVHLGGKFVDYT